MCIWSHQGQGSDIALIMGQALLKNKTKETLVPSAARDSRAKDKNYRMLEVTSL